VTALAIGCGPGRDSAPAPLDRLSFPTALATRGGELLVVSSNFDLFYDAGAGGSLLRVDPDASPQEGVSVTGGVRIPSLGGDLAIAEPAECEGLDAPRALVPTRSGNSLAMLRLAADGALACGASCELPLSGGRDPFGVAVVCQPQRPPRAYVGFLSTSDMQGSLVELDLLGGGQRLATGLGAGTIGSLAYDRETDRLYMTSREGGLTAQLRWLDLGAGCAIDQPAGAGGCPAFALEVWEFVRGAELRGLALSTPGAGPRRLYLSARLFDADLAGAAGGRPRDDEGGALLVFELEAGAAGTARPRFLRTVPVGHGAGQVRVLARPGKRDLVVVTATDDHELWIYDDESEAVAAIIGGDLETGVARLGSMPYALAVRPIDAATTRVYVASFAGSFVSAVDVDLASPSASRIVTVDGSPGGTPRRIGGTPR
jgi:hypothetical protein